jgi:hypothetical protein
MGLSFENTPKHYKHSQAKMVLIAARAFIQREFPYFS